MRPKPIRLLEEHQGKASGHWIWQLFLGHNIESTGQHQNQKCEYIKLKNFLPKDIINRVKSQPMKWKKNICKLSLTDKGLIVKIHKFL